MGYLGKILGVVTIICFSSCYSLQIKPDEKLVVYFLDGNIFCEGSYFVYQSSGIERKNKKGTWKFYYPSGSVESIYEYDINGNLLDHKKYDNFGRLLVSQVNSESLNYYLEFYENGSIKYEKRTNIKTELDEDSNKENVTYHGIERNYFSNGIIKSETELIDKVPHGKAKQWDSSGNLILEFEYVKGLIKPL